MDKKLTLVALIVLLVANYGSEELLGYIVAIGAFCYLIGGLLGYLYLRYCKGRKDVDNPWDITE